MSCNQARVEFTRWLRDAVLSGPCGVAPHCTLTKEIFLPWLVFMILFPTWTARSPLPKPASWVGVPNPTATAQHSRDAIQSLTSQLPVEICLLLEHQC